MNLGLIFLLFYMVLISGSASYNAESGSVIVPLSSDYINQWLILGPFQGNDLDRNFLSEPGGEANIKPKEGDKVKTPNGQMIEWKRYISQEKAVSLSDAVGKYEDVIAYAFCEVVSPKTQQAEMMIGSDDGVKVWINGKMVHKYSGSRGLNLDNDSVFIHLNEDMNRILIKVGNRGADWGFSTRFRDYKDYMSSISDELRLSVQRESKEGKTVLAIETGRQPLSNVWSLPSEPVIVSITDDRGQHIARLKVQEWQPYSWTVPVDYIKRRLAIVAEQVDKSGKRRVSNKILRESAGKEGIWKTYRYVDGLSGNRVYTVFQDKAGLIWFGTDGGVSRFDGKYWRTYTQEDGLAWNTVFSIFQDNEGAMWFGTSDGVSRFDGKHWRKYTSDDGLAYGVVWAILQDKEGVMWFGTYKGISRFDRKNWRTYTEKDGLAKEDVRAIIQDTEGTIWFGTDGGGVSCFDGKRWITYSKEDGLASNYVYEITQGKDGTVWVGTNAGLSRFDGKIWKTYTEQDGLGNDVVNAIIQDKEGIIWAGTWWGGLCRFNGKSWKTYTKEDGLTSNAICCLMEDREDGIWVGTDDGGVSRFDKGNWRIYIHEDGLWDDRVWDIIQDKNGNMWFIIWGVAGQFDGGNWYEYKNQWVTSVIEDKDGVIWFGTDEGIARFDGKNMKIFTERDGLTSNQVSAIFQSNDGAIWVGTADNGVSRYDGESWQTYTQKDGLSGNQVSTITQDKEGSIWVGSRFTGFSRFDGSNWRSQKNTKNELVSYAINDIIQDREGLMWFGTNDGVSCYDGKNWKTYTKKEGLASDAIFSIIQDREGMIWFGTHDNGIIRFDGRCFQTIDSRDGLTDDYVNCMYMDAKGQVWAGTQGGAIQFLPNSKASPPVYINEITADKETISLDGSLNKTTESLRSYDLPASVRRVAFDFHAISFKTRPGGMIYYYQLVGHDTDWQGPTHEEQVEYFDLKPGKYTFKVQAVDRNLNYSEPDSVSIAILSLPFYRTGMFIIVLGIVGVGSIFSVAILAVQRVRLSRLEKLRLQQELEDARQTQIRLLPESVPPVDGFEIAGVSRPAREVGGDFFDYFFLGDGKIGIALADISGKGLKAAMNAVLTNGMLHEVTKDEKSCSRILSLLNTDLCTLMERQMFTSLGFAIVERDGKFIQWANAAQPYPIVKRDDRVFELTGEGALPLGMMKNTTYTDISLDIQPGDIIIFYTDGVIEAENQAGEIYGTERLEQVIKCIAPEMKADEIIENVLQEIAVFVGDAEQYDDITIVVVKRLR